MRHFNPKKWVKKRMLTLSCTASNQMTQGTRRDVLRSSQPNGNFIWRRAELREAGTPAVPSGSQIQRTSESRALFSPGCTNVSSRHLGFCPWDGFVWVSELCIACAKPCIAPRYGPSTTFAAVVASVPKIGLLLCVRCVWICSHTELGILEQKQISLGFYSTWNLEVQTREANHPWSRCSCWLGAEWL